MINNMEDEIKNVDWECFCEEDAYTLKRKNIKPMLVYFDIDGNIYHYFKKGTLENEGIE